MKFKTRDGNPVVCGSAPVLADSKSLRIYRPGERVSLRPERTGLYDALNAEVLGLVGENVMVRALHDYFITVDECLARAGDEFEVSRDAVFIVCVPE